MPTAINPYNFIPFGLGPERRPLDEYYTGKLESGWIDVRLTVKTPLIIPDGAKYTPERVTVQKGTRTVEEEHRHYRFFRLPDKTPAIPGSTLRGLLRSVYEAATDSCLPFLQKEPDHPISQRTPIYAAFKDRGLLFFDQNTNTWTLYRAKAFTQKVCKEDVASGRYLGYTQGQRLKFAPKEDGTLRLGSGDREGWLQFNVPVDPSRPYHVAMLQPVEKLFEERVAEGEKAELFQSLHTAVYDTVKNAERNRLPSAQNDLLRCLKRVAKEGGAVPCYCFVVERGGRKLVYLSGAAVGRVRQRRNWADIMGKHVPCGKLDCLCPACALFGTVQDGGTAGRLRFSDARALEDCEKPVERTLPILSTPRTSSFEFYLRKPHEDATYWNFDYYGVRSSSTYEKDGRTVTVEHTEYRDLPEATPRGRKMYWHGEPQTTNRKSRQNATMEAVDKGSFRFRIWFESITRTQLGDLLWCISLGNNSETGKYRHKLGHGKPVGYGSVKLFVEDLRLRSFSSEGGFSACLTPLNPEELMGEQDRESALLEEQKGVLLAMTDFYARGKNRVAYLTGLDNRRRETIYSWFQINRMSADNVLTLPEPADDDLTLPTRRERPVAAEDAEQGDDRSGEAPGGIRRFSRGERLREVTVKGLSGSGKDAFFLLPGADCGGHCRVPNGMTLRRGQKVDVVIKFYNDRFDNYEVEVLQQ